ncbi:hypothetical protein NST66_28905 [Priestia sp. FSL W8-0524]|uniref:hypothetical protein n=1 Tax=Priestia sp. FSL W8-0524 TaxID=2954625 RepID=UPI0030F9B393
MLTTFKIMLMAIAFILTIGAVAEEKEHLRKDIQYILVFVIFALTATFIFTN